MGYLIIGGLKVLPVGAEVKLNYSARKRFNTTRQVTAKIVGREVRKSEVIYKLSESLATEMAGNRKILAKWVEVVELTINLEAINVKSD